ncbi:hypothetical protein KIW84_064089 [Lathyrus oleraceus]|uniref:Transmembrane protein n=1 Tax=Pisum sativum TaxID=3888 RepID=A0A9D4WBN2_PEA|nr:hypothetical protein KIW84_064089 [Pisum sativum]
MVFFRIWSHSHLGPNKMEYAFLLLLILFHIFLPHSSGFRVKPSDIVHVASEETFCYGDKASLGSVADSWKASQFESIKKGENSMIFDDFQQWTRNMPFNERVSWAIGGMVLTAGLVFISKRKSNNQRQKLAAIQRTARKLGRLVDQQQPSNASDIRNRISR